MSGRFGLAPAVIARARASAVFGWEESEDGPGVWSRGFVDLVYRDPDDGRMVVADYKTDAFVVENCLRSAPGFMQPQASNVRQDPSCCFDLEVGASHRALVLCRRPHLSFVIVPVRGSRCYDSREKVCRARAAGYGSKKTRRNRRVAAEKNSSSFAAKSHYIRKIKKSRNFRGYEVSVKCA